MKTINENTTLAVIAAILLIQEGGFSLTKRGAKITTGYSVATAGNESVFKMPDDLRDAPKKIQEYMDLFEPERGEFYGGWLDTSSGLVYLDISERFENLEEAKAAGINRKQLAIFDLENLETINLEETELERWIRENDAKTGDYIFE